MGSRGVCSHCSLSGLCCLLPFLGAGTAAWSLAFKDQSTSLPSSLFSPLAILAQLFSPVPPALANSRTFPAVTEALRITYNLKGPNWSQPPNVLFFEREVMAPVCAGPESQASCSPTWRELQRGRPAEERAKSPLATSTSCYWPAQDSGQVNFVFGCTPHSIWNLSSPPRDQTHAPCSGSLES